MLDAFTIDELIEIKTAFHSGPSGNKLVNLSIVQIICRDIFMDQPGFDPMERAAVKPFFRLQNYRYVRNSALITINT